MTASLRSSALANRSAGVRCAKGSSMTPAGAALPDGGFAVACGGPPSAGLDLTARRFPARLSCELSRRVSVSPMNSRSSSEFVRSSRGLSDRPRRLSWGCQATMSVSQSYYETIAAICHAPRNIHINHTACLRVKTRRPSQVTDRRMIARRGDARSLQSSVRKSLAVSQLTA